MSGQYVRQRQRRTPAQRNAGRGVPQPLPQKMPQPPECVSERMANESRAAAGEPAS